MSKTFKNGCLTKLKEQLKCPNQQQLQPERMSEASFPKTTWYNPYKDSKIMAVGIPLVTAAMTLIGTNTDFSNQESLLQLVVKLGYNALVVALCWIVVRQLIVFMDKRHPWKKGEETRRLLQQAPLVLLGMSMGYFSATILRTLFFKFWPIDWTEIWSIDYPLAILFLLLINFLYFYLWQQNLQPDSANTSATREESPFTKIKVLKGRAIVLLDPDQISFAYREHDINYLIDTKGVIYHWDDSLTALEASLPGCFRLNRQYLVKREAVKTYSVKSNRNLSVRLISLEGKLLDVNKNKAAAFRRWLNGE